MLDSFVSLLMNFKPNSVKHFNVLISILKPYTNTEYKPRCITQTMICFLRVHKFDISYVPQCNLFRVKHHLFLFLLCLFIQMFCFTTNVKCCQWCSTGVHMVTHLESSSAFTTLTVRRFLLHGGLFTLC